MSALKSRPGDATVPGVASPYGPRHFTATWPRHTPTSPSRCCRKRHPVRNTFAVIGAALFALMVIAIIFGKQPVTVIKGGEATHSSSTCQPYLNWPGSGSCPTTTT